MEQAISRMVSALDACRANRCDETLRAFVDACNVARDTFARLQLAGFESISKRRWPK